MCQDVGTSVASTRGPSCLERWGWTLTSEACVLWSVSASEAIAGSWVTPPARDQEGGWRWTLLGRSPVRGEVDQISLPSCVRRRGRRFPLRGPGAELGEPPRGPPAAGGGRALAAAAPDTSSLAF